MSTDPPPSAVHRLARHCSGSRQGEENQYQPPKSPRQRHAWWQHTNGNARRLHSHDVWPPPLRLSQPYGPVGGLWQQVALKCDSYLGLNVRSQTSPSGGKLASISPCNCRSVLTTSLEPNPALPG